MNKVVENFANDLDLLPEDVILIQSNLALTGLIANRQDSEIFCKSLIGKIQEQVTDKGGILLPAFTYSFGKSEVYKPHKNAFENMGLLSTWAAKNGFHTNFDPMFQFLGWGGQVWSMFDQERPPSSHGPGSLFRELINRNIKILMIGTGCASTLIHEIEMLAGVNYRFLKKFDGLFENENHTQIPIIWHSYVRKLDFINSEPDFTQLNSQFPLEEEVRTIRFGKLNVIFFTAKELEKFVFEKLHENQNYLIKAN